ncbi:MAG: translation initiation factor IF-2, partial [Spirochaetaceae bacterium]|nr:translation initiation factor IF-2 [Spirochaetaceae bacterium]
MSDEKKVNARLIKKQDNGANEQPLQDKTASGEAKPKRKVVVVKKVRKPEVKERGGDGKDKATEAGSAVKVATLESKPRVVARAGNLAGGLPLKNERPANPERRGNFTRPDNRERPAGSRPYNNSSAGGSGERRFPSSSAGAGSSYNNNRSSGGYNRPTGAGTRPNSSGGAPRFGGQGGGRFNNNSAAPTVLPEAVKRTGAKVFKGKKNTPKEQYDSEKAYQFNKRKAQAAINPIPDSIDIMEQITVAELARKMNLKASVLIAKLMTMGMMVTMNQQIDAETAEILATEYNCKVKVISLYDEVVIASEEISEEAIKQRPPIVTIMGHVDHGKTKTLDAIRSSNVVAGEHGGITQHIGAYAITTASGQKVTFLDTPGHEAFTMMRARGAKVTDIVVLVVSATEGIMAQTLEAIDHAKAAEVPIIVAVNKMDLPNANPDRIKQQLSDYGLIAEDWGGQTMFVPISAYTQEGIDKLIEAILLQAEVMELKASFSGRAEGTVIEARIDQGRGIAATVLISRGELKIGDPFVAGVDFGKVRAIYNDGGEKIKIAYPGDPVEITGFSEGAPEAGDPFQVTIDERTASSISAKRRDLRRMEGAKSSRKVTLSNLYDTIAEGDLRELRVVIKGDVHGSVEALKQALEKLSNSEIKLVVLRAAAGAIVEQDITLASASNAIVIGFQVRPTTKAQAVADAEKVEIRKYTLIYEAVEDITLAMEGMLSPELREEVTGTAEIRKVFSSSKIGLIAGCMVTKGFITRKSNIHVIRDNVVIAAVKVLGLKR